MKRAGRYLSRWKNKRIFMKKLELCGFSLGSAYIEHGLVLAPMAGATDYAFREVCRAHGACNVTPLSRMIAFRPFIACFFPLRLQIDKHVWPFGASASISSRFFCAIEHPQRPVSSASSISSRSSSNRYSRERQRIVSTCNSRSFRNPFDFLPPCEPPK